MPPKKTSVAKLQENFENAYSLWMIEMSDAKSVINDPDNATLEDLEDALQSLRESYDELKKSTAFCLTEENSKILQTAAGEFHSLRKSVNSQVKDLKAAEEKRDKTKVSSTHPTHHSSSVQLKKLTCPTWEGDIRKYKRFRKNFELLVQDHTSPELALIRLKDALKPNSREDLIVQSKSNISEAWEALDAIYGRANSIKDAVLRDVQELKPVSDESDADGLRCLVTELTLAKEDLKAVKRQSALGESAFSILMEKIPVELRRKIDEKILDDDLSAEESFELFIKLADKAASVEEVAQLRAEAHIFSHSNSRQGTEAVSKNYQLKTPADGKDDAKPGGDRERKEYGDGARKQGSRYSDRRGGNGRKKFQDSKGEKSKNSQITPEPCVIHPSNSHRTSECRTFLGQSSEEKKKILKDGKRCEKCFSSAHQLKDCNSKHSCKESRCRNPESHHTLIHAACLAVSLSAKTVSAQSKPKSQLQVNQLRHHLGHTTLRPSHKAYVKHRGKLVEVSVLYDLGATVSQIQDSVAQKVGLKPVNVVRHLLMKTAGKAEAEDWGPTNLYNVPLYDVQGTLAMVISCVGVSYIGELDGGSYGSALSLFEDNGLDLSTLLHPVDGPIEILIGDNHAEVFPRTITSRGNIVLAETRLGQILHGSHSTFYTPRTNAEGMLLSGVLDVATQRAAHCLAYAVSKDTPVSDFIEDLKPQGQGHPSPSRSQPATPTAQVFTVKARSGSSSTDMSKDIHPVIMAVKTSEETAFDRLCALENSPTCYKCERCPDSEASPEEERRLQVYKSCLMYDSERKVFVCRLPWKENFKTLADNRPMALKRLISLTRSMVKDNHLRSWYVEEFEKLIDAGYMIEIKKEEDDQWKNSCGNAYYICHFAHLNENSASTPLRVIFDASVPFRGLAINSLWEPPPNLIPPIPTLLLRFQERKIPLAMDISKAYLTVHLDTEESHLHRLLWNRLEPDQEVKTFRLLRNSWGTTPAGGICSVAMLVIAEKYRKDYPHVYEFVKTNLYVDDGTSSVDDVKTALTLARDLAYVLGQASFKIKHFMIGGEDVDITEIHNFEEIPANVRKTEDQERILGVLYHSGTDEFSISARINFSKKKRGVRVKPDVSEENFDAEFPEKFSQRLYLQNIATVYDPTGLATPATIGMKHELGKIFRLKLGWDDVIPEGDDSSPTTRSRCKELIRTIYGLRKVHFARCLTPRNAVGSPILAVFCDSSQNAYGCVAYYNWRLEDGTRESRLAMAKAKPFPKTPVLTIPRGEMSGSVMGARIKNTILKKTSFKFEKVIMMTDSTIVLGQIRHEPYKFNTWTASRVDEIQRLTQPCEWHHVDSENNVADDASRGLDPSQMGRNSRWQKGPDFMKEDPENWPIIALEDLHVQKEQEFTDIRLKDPRMVIGRCKTLCIKSKNDDASETVSSEDGSEDSATSSEDEESEDSHNAQSEEKEENFGKIIHALESLEIKSLDKSDSWVRAKRRISRIIRFIETAHELYKAKLQKKVNFKRPDLKTMSSAERPKWYCENDDFVPTKREMAISALFLIRQAQKSLPKDVKRSLGALNPEQDVDGVWRAAGRTKAAVRNPPIIISRSEPLAEVLVRHFHCPQHSGSDTTLALVRQQYWIIDGQRFANSYVSRCACCRFLRKKISQVEIAPRKSEQLLRSPVFQYVVLDLAGPFTTLADRRETRNYRVQTGKVWILVLVCRATGAVHIEVLEGYDTNSFLAGFDAFTRIRGKPTTVTADLGSQIRSAANVMESLWNHAKITKLQTDPENTTWNFVPSGAHSSVGQAERMIRVIKNTLEAVTRSRKPEFTKLRMQRLMYHVADIINDRPLGVHRNNVGKLDANRLLRPNDLILGRSNGTISRLIDFSQKMSAEQMDYTEIISTNEKFLDSWWKVWYHQIFPILLPREKWTQPARGVMTGDIVIVRDTNPVRNQWTWGEVDSVNYSQDGKIRTVTVRYKLDKKSKFVTKSSRDLVVILRNEERNG